ncbi:MAG: hypothetical protein JW735_09925 [Prolixibacteraceae bacterium]|nr:hypothetical protein [Prolixibacteraceae bacterium]
MKKLLVVLGLIFVLLLAAFFVVPVLYKEKISQLALQKINTMVDARINYESFDLALLRSFPDFTATFQNISVVGKNQFENDTLLYFGYFSATLDVMSVLRKSDVLLKSLEISNGKLNFIAGTNGAYNWEIEQKTTLDVDSLNLSQKETSNTATNEPDQQLKLLLKSIVLSDIDVVYLSRSSDYEFAVYDVNGKMQGEMQGMNTLLNVEIATPSLNYRYGKVYYLKNLETAVNTKLNADLNKFDFKFEGGSSKLNNFPLDLKGGFSMPGDSILFDIQFDVPDISMPRLLQLVPQDYQKYLANVKTDGNINFDGSLLGVYYNNVYPSIAVNFDVSNAWLQYPELPDRLEIVKLKAEIVKPEGELDKVELGISQFDMFLADNPLSLQAAFSQLFTDPKLDVSFNGVVDLETLSKVIPLGDTQLKGMLTANAIIAGNYSSIESGSYQNFKSEGELGLSKFYIINSSVPQGVEISNAALKLKNETVDVDGLQGRIGRSDFRVSGSLNNVISYMWAGGELYGKLKWQSLLLDLNEFMAAYQPADSVKSVYLETDSTQTASTGPIELPEKMHLVFDADVKQMLIDKMNITNTKGNVVLKNQHLYLNGLNMDMIGGRMKMDGKAIADGRLHPDVDFTLDIKNFDIKEAYRQLSLVQKYMPFAASSQGSFSTKLNMQTQLSDSLKLIASELNAKGALTVQNLKLVDARILKNLSTVIASNKLRNVQVDNFTAHYAIKDGNLNIEPFSTKVMQQPVRLGGTYNLGGTVDLRVDATVDKSLLSNNLLSMIAYVPGHERIQKIDVGMLVKGDAKKPEIIVDNDKIKQQVINQLKNSSPKELEDAAKKLFNDIFK